MPTNKLSQILAIEAGLKSSSHDSHTAAYQAAQKPAIFNGFQKVYQPKTDGGETFPPEAQRVQVKVRELLTSVEKELTPYYDATFTKDRANCNACADIVLEDGKVVATKVPATHLLFLVKHLTEFKNFLASLPVLDLGEDWTLDPNAAVFKSASTKTHRTKKNQKPIVLYDATDKHPAQTQLITEDEVVGYWDTTKFSGALPLPEKQALNDRVEALIRATQQALWAANGTEAPAQSIAKSLFDFVVRGQ